MIWRLSLAIAAVAAVLLGVAMADAELVQRGDLRLSFDGRFAPQRLPRNRPAPITVSLSGSVVSTSESRPPQLRRISIALNRYGSFFTRGLPTCEAGRLETTSTQLALSRCGDALIGRGRFDANVDLSTVAFPVEGKVLAFNGRAAGAPVILLHVYGTKPVAVTEVLPFRISHPHSGTYGTVISARIPKIAADLGYVTHIELTLGRRYMYGGRMRSFLSARCAAPAGFPGALFPLARGSFTFAGGKLLTTTLTRGCHVR
ncbi:MAG: hypothetical protein WBM00_01320 [Solirubrobacterales bacterium]